MVRILEDVADLGRDIARRQAGDVALAQHRRARRRRIDVHQQPGERRLARTVPPAECNDLALAEREVDVGQDRLLALIAEAQIAHGEKRLLRRGHGGSLGQGRARPACKMGSRETHRLVDIERQVGRGRGRPAGIGQCQGEFGSLREPGAGRHRIPLLRMRGPRAREKALRGSPSKTMDPRSIITTRVTQSASSSTRCSTMTMVVPASRLSRRSTPKISAMPFGSRLAVGSSRTSRRGRAASTAATETRCFWPPERSKIERSPKSPIRRKPGLRSGGRRSHRPGGRDFRGRNGPRPGQAY